MRVRQRIYKTGGGHVTVPTGRRLHFTDVGADFGGSYWKVHQLARDRALVGRRPPPAPAPRPGRPQAQLLPPRPRADPRRDAARPATAHYRGCNQNPYQDRVTLGTSVGWSDIYPADYDKQWIGVAGLRGCFAFVMTGRPAKPALRVERARQRSRRLVRLPYRRRAAALLSATAGGRLLDRAQPGGEVAERDPALAQDLHSPPASISVMSTTVEGRPVSAPPSIARSAASTIASGTSAKATGPARR